MLKLANRSSVCLTALGATLLLGVSSAPAAPIVNFDISVLGGSSGPYSTSLTQEGVAAGALFNYNTANDYFWPDQGPGPYSGALNDPIGDPDGAPEWQIESWGFNGDDDPSGSGANGGARLGTGFVIKNLRPQGATAADNHLQFSILISMDLIGPAVAQSFVGNAAMTLTIDNPNPPNSFNGVLTSIDSPVWDAMLNGAHAVSLFDHGTPPFTLGGGPGTAGTSGTVVSSQWSSLVGTTVDSMGIRLHFDLTPGEKISFTGLWRMNPVIPAPGALALLGLAGIMARGRRRR